MGSYHHQSKCGLHSRTLKMMISATEEALSRSMASSQFLLTFSHSPKLQSFKVQMLGSREKETQALSNINCWSSGIYCSNKQKKKPDYAACAKRNNAMHKLDWDKTSPWPTNSNRVNAVHDNSNSSHKSRW